MPKNEHPISPLRLLCLPLIIAGMVIAIELVLEVRHIHFGYKTLLLSPIREVINKPGTQKNVLSDMPYKDGKYVFRNAAVQPKKNTGIIRIWMSSASHAEHLSLPMGSIFPNRIYKKLCNSGMPCEMLNASVAGLDVQGNVEWMNALGKKYKPDYALLYQLSMEISEAQRDFMEPSTFMDRASPLLNLQPLRETLQRSSIYPLVNQYLGGNILLSGFMAEAVPPEATARFVERVQQFLNACRATGVTPVIMTFAVSHDLENINEMPRADALWFVKYNHALSPHGWVSTVHEWNKELRKVAESEHVLLIDIEPVMSGKPEYFVDFVHFNQVGHEKIAELTVDFLLPVLRGGKAQ